MQHTISEDGKNHLFKISFNGNAISAECNTDHKMIKLTFSEKNLETMETIHILCNLPAESVVSKFSYLLSKIPYEKPTEINFNDKLLISIYSFQLREYGSSEYIKCWRFVTDYYNTERGFDIDDINLLQQFLFDVIIIAKSLIKISK